VISGFRREADENCALMAYYDAANSNFLPTFRYNVLIHLKGSRCLSMGTIGRLETSISNFHSSLRSNHEECSSEQRSLIPSKNPCYLFTYTLTVAQWLRYCATNRKVAGSIPDGVIGIFY
jgi:hypothetical protein